METLENRPHGGAGAISRTGDAFGEAMRDFLAYLDVPVVLDNRGAMFNVVNSDGKKCSVSSKGQDENGEQMAHDVTVKMEQGFRKASCWISANQFRMPRIILTAAKLHLVKLDGKWALSRVPSLKELSFQVSEGGMPAKDVLIKMMKASVDGDFYKKEQRKDAA